MKKTDLRKGRGAGRVVRILPDGAREIEFANGRRMRIAFYCCVECYIEQPDYEFRVYDAPHMLATTCASCREQDRTRKAKERLDADPEHMKFMAQVAAESKAMEQWRIERRGMRYAVLAHAESNAKMGK